MSERPLPRVVHEWEIGFALNQGNVRYRLVEAQRDNRPTLILERLDIRTDAMGGATERWEKSKATDSEDLKIVMDGLRDAASRQS